MNLAWFALLLALAPGAFGQPRVVLLSLDGLGYQFFTEDPIARELRTLKDRAHRALVAPMRSTWPSLTAPAHAALFTGAWGDVNGITSNTQPLLPRARHPVFETQSGFLSPALAAEPIWAVAARQGVTAVSYQGTQNAPLQAISAAPDAGVPPVMVKSYGYRTFAPHRLITAGDVTEEPLDAWQPPLPTAGGPWRGVRWRVDQLTLHAALGDGAVWIAADPAGARVRAALAPLESEPPRGRPLARHFSSGLRINEPYPAVLYFRLFEEAPDRRNFVIYQSPIHEFHFTRGMTEEVSLRERLLAEAGGLIDGGFRALASLDDDAALRRSLEVAELYLRQTARQQAWLLRHVPARLMQGYFNQPDEALHSWLALARANPRYEAKLRWLFAALDRALEDVLAELKPEDVLVVVSDHGMAEVRRHVRIYPLLERVGLVATTAAGKLDEPRSKVAYFYANCLLVNTQDWKDGLIPRGDRDALLGLMAQVLAEFRDPDRNEQVFTAFYRRGEHEGIVGEAGPDLCFDLAPGYAVSTALVGEVVSPASPERGAHGFAPVRADMQALFLGLGPMFDPSRRPQDLRIIDVAPLVTRLLGIQPPRQARGRWPGQLGR